KRLQNARLVEDLREERVRLHPLVREFAAARTPLRNTQAFRQECARRLADSYRSLARLQDVVRLYGVDVLEQSLETALILARGAEDERLESLSALLRLFQREAHHLRAWDPARHPSYLAQQVLHRASVLGPASLTALADARLAEL